MIRVVPLFLVITSCTAFTRVPAISKLRDPAVGRSALVHYLRPSERFASRTTWHHKRHTSGVLSMAALDRSGAVTAVQDAYESALGMLLDSGLKLEEIQGPPEMTLAGGEKGIVRSFASANRLVSWCSALDVVGDAHSYSSLTVWNGPSIGVPHFRSSVAVSNEDLHLLLDFTPRFEGAYHTRNSDGSYPEPTTRQMFVEKGERTAFAEQFGTKEVEQWADSLRASPGSQPASGATPQGCAGPLAVELTMPISADAVQVVRDAVQDAAELYLCWMEGAEDQGLLKSTHCLAHDNKVRPNICAWTSARLVRLFGKQAKKLAKYDAGPVDVGDPEAMFDEINESDIPMDEDDAPFRSAAQQPRTPPPSALPSRSTPPPPSSQSSPAAPQAPATQAPGAPQQQQAVRTPGASPEAPRGVPPEAARPAPKKYRVTLPKLDDETSSGQGLRF